MTQSYYGQNKPHITTVAFHENCADGFAAAAITYRFFGQTRTVVYVPVQYKTAIPENITAGGKGLLFVDFCPEREQLKELLDLWEYVYVIDHHESRKWVKDEFPNNCYFDLNYSGAYLTWKWFYPESPVPELIRYVQDRDLWKWELEDSRAISAALRRHEFSLHQWAEWTRKFPKGKLASEGKIILDVQERIFHSRAKQAKLVRLADRENVYIVNSTEFISETCERILAIREEVNTAVCYFLLDSDRVVLSFRAREGAECLTLAQHLGGGGHPRAAGATLTMDKFREIISEAT